MRNKVFFVVPIFLLLSSLLSADDLIIQKGDIYIEIARDSEGFDLWIKAREGMGSVLLSESSADPDMRADSFTLRAYDYNEVNGDEKRILNGKFMESSTPLYFLMDSTPEYNELLESQAYHVFVPLNVTYGYSYPGSREGQIEIRKGTWLNIRTFELPYADYSGAYHDNPFILEMEELPPPTPPALDVEKEEKILTAMADETEGIFTPVDDTEAAAKRIAELITRGDDVDVVLVIDTTISMKNDVAFLRQNLLSMVEEQIMSYSRFRIGMVLYRDYKDAYLTHNFPFEYDLDAIQGRLNMITVDGGGDKQEAVYEGLYDAIINYDWQAGNRLIIQVGDAMPHTYPKGKITEDMVFDAARALGIQIYPILLPDN
ncbi:MAG: hypothetical protein PQJ60_12055 [Spirochaetales bacterium]|nr:hypothetical protein [Spirochaetales bacterium]